MMRSKSQHEAECADFEEVALLQQDWLARHSRVELEKALTDP
jgi:hypothetical protein